MAPSREDAGEEDYFNDLSQQLPQQGGEEERRGSQEGEDASAAAKKKRIACVLCRKRKLKCDGERPACGTCKRLQHTCSYDEARRKSGPKRGYVKALEARLAQVETLLKTTDDPPTTTDGGLSRPRKTVPHAVSHNITREFPDVVIGSSNVDMLPHIQKVIDRHDGPAQSEFPHIALDDAANRGSDQTAEEAFPWEMIGLGLDEPLPTQDVIDELNLAFFDKVHPSIPMIHRPRYYAAMHLAPHMRPPVCLRYAMWCSAASVLDKYESLQDHFYQRARKYVQQDEMKGHGENMITLAHCQTWVILATYEFKLMYFPRAWMSAGRACRLAQMMGLHRLDGTGLDVKQCLPPPRDWTEREERRRTFWMSFCTDRYSSIGTGWPMTIEERDILTNLPGEEHAFELSKPSKTMSLEEALDPDGTSRLSGYAGVILMATLFGRNLTHLHRPGPDDRDDDLNGDFWKRHRAMDNILLNTALTLPDHLRLPTGLNDPNIVFLNMNIHTSTICLHQAAIFKADKNRMPARVSAESKVRCITSAAEVASIMRSISHLDLSTMNPFISFCLYVGARVFVQYLKSRPKDEQVRASLQFLLSAMHAIKRKNPLTESFLVQLDVDLEGAGLQDIAKLKAQMTSRTFQGPNRTPGCPYEHQGMDSTDNGRFGEQSAGGRPPAYGDQGLAVYNDPNPSSTHNSKSNDQPPIDAMDQPTAFVMGGGQFDLPSRQQRTPGQDSTMDTSPDGSGEQHTPSSASNPNNSSHTSNTAYSPQNQHHEPFSNSMGGPDSGALNGTGLLNPQSNTFTADFDMGTFASSTGNGQDPGFVLPHDWNESTGLTPGMSTGMTPINMNDTMGMSDADWSQMMEGLNGGWEAFPEHNQGQYMRH